MSRPPLANLFAVHDEDPTVLEAIAADLAESREFAEVWRPASGWVAASAPLPGGAPDGIPVQANRLAFAEGRDRLSAGSVEPPHEVFRRVAELADVSPDRLVTLPGDCGFIRFRPGGDATVVRSCGGLVPFYLRQSGHGVAVSTRLGDFVRYLPDEPRLDPLVNAIWTTGYGLFPDGRTFLADVTILNRGAMARIVPGRPFTIGRYWNPRPQYLTRPTPARAREHAERLRALLLDTLTRDLDPEGGNLLTLSGGVDSSSLAALAAGVVGRPIWTFSFLPEPEDQFECAMSYIQPLADRFSFERMWPFRLRQETRLELLRKAPRIVFHVIHPALGALPGLMREAPVRVLFGGEFADEVCGSAYTLPDWLTHTAPLELIAGIGRLPFGPRDLLRWAKSRWLAATGRFHPPLPFPMDLPDCIRPEIRDEYHTWRNRRQHEAAQDRDPHRYLALRTELDNFVTMNWEAASALGIRRSFPFFTREVLELAFECHPSELIGPGTKKLLRTALRHDVPEKNLQQPKTYFDWKNDAQLVWETPLQDMLETVVQNEWMRKTPTVLDYSRACLLSQLMIFVESLGLRRAGYRPRLYLKGGTTR